MNTIHILKFSLTGNLFVILLRFLFSMFERIHTDTEKSVILKIMEFLESTSELISEMG